MRYRYIFLLLALFIFVISCNKKLNEPVKDKEELVSEESSSSDDKSGDDSSNDNNDSSGDKPKDNPSSDDKSGDDSSNDNTDSSGDKPKDNPPSDDTTPSEPNIPKEESPEEKERRELLEQINAFEDQDVPDIDSDIDNSIKYYPYYGNFKRESENQNMLLSRLTRYMDISTISNPRVLNIDDKEINEISTFTKNLLRSANLSEKSQEYQVYFINGWLYTNVSYYRNEAISTKPGRSLNDPYEAFRLRKAVCYGYSNLMKVMLNSLGIPCMVVNGWLLDRGARLAHSWVWAKTNESWIVADPTNGPYYLLEDYKKYNTKLSPFIIEVSLFKDDNFEYGFSEGINIFSVRHSGESLRVPDTYNRIPINSLSLFKNLPAGVKSLKLGRFITSISESGTRLSTSAKELEAIYISKKNKVFYSEKGIVYKKASSDPYYIPESMRIVRLKAQNKYGKNVVLSKEKVEIVYFPKGTKEISDFAVENCPALKYVLAPKDATIAPEAFSRVGKYKLIRY